MLRSLYRFGVSLLNACSPSGLYRFIGLLTSYAFGSFAKSNSSLRLSPLRSVRYCFLLSPLAAPVVRRRSSLVFFAPMATAVARDRRRKKSPAACCFPRLLGCSGTCGSVFRYAAHSRPTAYATTRAARPLSPLRSVRSAPKKKIVSDFTGIIVAWIYAQISASLRFAHIPTPPMMIAD